MDEQRITDHIADDPGHDVDRMIGRPDLEEPRSRPTRTRQLEVIAGQPNDEDLGLDRALDVETLREPRHRAIVRRGDDYSLP
jgi:hypothetical protein